MNSADILQEVQKLIKKYEGRSAKQTPVTLSTKLFEELDIDSARLVDIVLDIEAKFDITIDDATLPKLKTVGDFVALVEGLIKPA